MRRLRQQITQAEAEKILFEGRECVLAVDGDDEYPYAVPVNYVYDGDKIYIHSASQGHKIDSMKRNPKLSLCVIGRGDIVPDEFTTYFRSAVVFGRARFIEREEDKEQALVKLCQKYCGSSDPMTEISRFLKTVAIIEITIDQVTGKESIELTRMR